MLRSTHRDPMRCGAVAGAHGALPSTTRLLPDDHRRGAGEPHPKRLSSTQRRRTPMTTSTITTATAAEADPVIAVLTLAFRTDPGVRWTYPDPQQYLRPFPRLVHAFGGKAFTHGSAYTVEGYAGAALWLPPDVHPDEDV